MLFGILCRKYTLDCFKILFSATDRLCQESFPLHLPLPPPFQPGGRCREIWPRHLITCVSLHRRTWRNGGEIFFFSLSLSGGQTAQDKQLGKAQCTNKQAHRSRWPIGNWGGGGKVVLKTWRPGSRISSQFVIFVIRNSSILRQL